MKTLMIRALGAACAVGCLAGALVAQDAAAPTSDAKAPTRSESAPAQTTSNPVATPAANGGGTGGRGAGMRRITRIAHLSTRKWSHDELNRAQLVASFPHQPVDGALAFVAPCLPPRSR